LIVDDDQAIREALSDALELEGYRVVGVEHGAAAMRHLETGARPCLILLDLMMPVMDGKAFRSAMLGEPALMDIPVVVITAGGPQTAAAMNALNVLHKPLSMNTVMDVVKEHCPGGAAA
jgi:CheY-like chemotaxis protein